MVFTPILLGLIWAGGLALQTACFALGMLMLWEYLQLTQAAKSLPLVAVTYLLTATALAATVGWLPPLATHVLVPSGILLVLITVLMQPEPLATSMQRGAMVGLGVLYAGGLIPYLARLRDVPQDGIYLCTMALLCTWGADTGAYFTGRALGRRKLYPKVSPGKTLEGGIGGLCWAVAIACAMRAVFHIDLSWGQGASVGVIAALFGTLGDLCESMLKRSVGAKDSSALIPGHGGVLDRFDGVMFAVPAVYIYLVVCVRPELAIP